MVYGGLSEASLDGSDYNTFLNTSGCGLNTDILDAHYIEKKEPFAWFEDINRSGNVYSDWIASGRSLGCWETECGCQYYAHDPLWLPTNYWVNVVWALRHNWNHKDKYRRYIFSYYDTTNSSQCPGSPSAGLFSGIAGTRQWPNGYSISTLMQTLRGDLDLASPSRLITQSAPAYSYFNNDTWPLSAGGRLVLPFKPSTYSPPGQATNYISVTLKPGETVQSVSRITLIKGTSNSLPFAIEGNPSPFRWLIRMFHSTKRTWKALCPRTAI